MMHRLAAMVVAGVVGVGCSSNGATGPQGPPGPKGDTGTGTPGVSVLSASLSRGSLDCPAGGSQFTSVSATTFACNGEDGSPGVSGQQGAKGDKGDQGIQGPPGAGSKRLILKSADGSVIGPVLYASFQIPAGGSVTTYVEALGLYAVLDRQTGVSLNQCYFVYATADCSGPGLTSNAFIESVCGIGAALYRLASPTAVDLLSGSSMGTPGRCIPESSPQNSSGYPVVQVFDSRYPYAAPLQIVYE